jgi:hypothetical protein
MRSYLIVANRTLMGPNLIAAVRARSEAEPSRFHVLVPSSEAGSRRAWTSEGASHAQAEKRLGEALERFREAGVEITGEIGDESPVLAVGDVLRREPFDEIILSTLPPGASKWLKRDLPHKLARNYHLPVTHVIGASQLVS